MKTMILAAAIIGLIFADASFAQPMMKWRGSGGWGGASRYNMMYNTNTVENVNGKIVKIAQITPMKGMSQGVHLVMKTDKDTVDVHLGPAWYIENQDVKLKAGDKIEIRGSRISFQGRPVIIAAEVKKDGETLKLRDEHGFPMWAGWRSTP